MSGSSKFDLSSGSPDRPLYTSGQRGSYAAASLDRSGSFRENMESPALPAPPNMTRGSSAATQGDVASFLQCLRFDPKSMVSNHKLNRPVDFKRLASLSLGVPLEDSTSLPSKGKSTSSPSPEDFRRLKASLRKSCTNARERVKIFNESLSGMIKLFPTIPSRKRSRSDALSNERSSILYPTDRSVSGTGLSKIGTQNQVSTNGFEVEQKPEERTKGVPNKRTRTSMMDPRMDARANTPARPSGIADRDREILKIPNNSATLSEDRTLPIADGWEKSKMKKKRSGIKLDLATSSAASKPIDSPRDSKQVMQQRILTDPRSRLNDTHGFRPGVANGGQVKVDGTSQQMGSGMRSSMYRPEQDNSHLLQDKRDRSLEKDKLNLKAINKSGVREDFSSGSPTSGTKLGTIARAPRSGSTVGPKMSPVVSRPVSSNDWELSQCTSKLPSAVGVNCRKRTPSMRSSSPPVAQWASHRPQKISRTARRTNFIPIVQSNGECGLLDTTSNIVNERRLSGNSPQQLKLKGENFSSAALSESEESGAVEMKSKEKTKKSDDIDEKAGLNVQKLSNLMLPPRKNKVINGDDHGDGVRRQGRTGRGFTSTRSLMPFSVEKLGNVGTAKQLRSTRLGFDKTESKTGRPPSRKLSDRKAYTRQKHAVVNSSADFLVGSDDGSEELLAAANAVINSAHALSSSFWKQMEPIFRFISDLDLTVLNQQINLKPAVASSALVPSVVEAGFAASSFRFNELEREQSKTKHVENYQEHLASGTGNLDEIPLYQRLIAAIIPEGEEELCCSGNEGETFDAYESGFELMKDVKSDSVQSHMLHSSDLSGHTVSNGYRISANGRPFSEMEQNIPDDNIISSPDAIPSFDNSQNGLLPEQAMASGSICTEFQYNNMSLSERLLLEIHCIGIYPEIVPDSGHTGDGDIAGEICRLSEKYHDQVSKRKDFLNRFLNSSIERREHQEREFEQNALDKLVTMAYEKYMTCWGPHAHGMKSASGKMAKQAALAFVKRTLGRCHDFEVSGKSCFNEPLFRDMFLSGVSRLADGQTMDSIVDGEFGKIQGNTSSSLNEVRSSGTQQSPSLTNQDIYSSEALLSGNLTSQQTCKEESWSSRVKKKELLLDDVGGGAIGMGIASGIGSSFISSAKGKRSERDREGKGNSREVFSRGGTTKTGRPMSNNVKGERKPKPKPKQRTTQLSVSVNGLLGKMPEKPKGTSSSVAKSSDISSSGVTKDKMDYSLDDLEERIDLSDLQLPGMDVLGVPDDFGGQGQDLGSWLNIEDDGMQDGDFMRGLDIPMDDLTDVHMI